MAIYWPKKEHTNSVVLSDVQNVEIEMLTKDQGLAVSIYTQIYINYIYILLYKSLMSVVFLHSLMLAKAAFV